MSSAFLNGSQGVSASFLLGFFEEPSVRRRTLKKRTMSKTKELLEEIFEDNLDLEMEMHHMEQDYYYEAKRKQDEDIRTSKEHLFRPFVIHLPETTKRIPGSRVCD